DWSSDVCSSDLKFIIAAVIVGKPVMDHREKHTVHFFIGKLQHIKRISCILHKFCLCYFQITCSQQKAPDGAFLKRKLFIYDLFINRDLYAPSLKQHLKSFLDPFTPFTDQFSGKTVATRFLAMATSQVAACRYLATACDL